jgi:ABC-type nitrate/sulfonate/bicarbonate transport system permease component
MYKSIKDYTATFLVLFICLALWEIGVRWFDVPDYILPAPSRVLYVFFSRFTFLLGHASMTLLEVALGIIFGTAGGILLALVIFYYPWLERALYPLIIASQMIPIFAIAPLLVLWFGYGIWPKVTVASLIVFFPIVINTIDGLRAVGSETIDLLRSLRASEWKIFRMIRLPASLPSLFSGLKVGITLSVVGATIGEWIGAKQGLGYLMIQSNALLRTDLVFASILALSLLGLLLFALLCMIERRLLRWRIPEERKARR